MRILAIDTSSRDRVTGAIVEDEGHRGRSVPGGAVDRILVPLVVDLGVDGLDAVVVTTGPGSYTGVRAGMAAGLGLAAAAGLPLHGCGALEVVAHGAPPGVPRVGAVAAAGRGGVYTAVFARDGGLEAVAPPRREEVATWRPDPGLTWVALEAAPDGVEAWTLCIADAVDALAAAARDAVRRPPLDTERLRTDTGAGGRP